MFLKDGGSQGSPDFSDKFPFQKDRVEQARCGLMSGHSSHMLTAGIVAMQVCQFQKDRVEQSMRGLLSGNSSHRSTADIVAMPVCQFQKDRVEQAKHTVSVTGYYHKVAFHMRFQDIALSYMRTTFILDGFLVGCDLASLGLTATSSGNTLGYLSLLIVAMKLCQFHKDRDEQAQTKFEFVFTMNVQIVGYQVDSLVLPIANVSLARSQFGAIVADLYQFTVILMFAGFKGRRIGEASNPGPRLRRRGPRSFEARAAREGRRASPSSSDSVVESGEPSLTMLHLNMRGYLSHIAEVTALIRDLPAKPFLVSLNETFLSEAIEQVKLEGYQVLARRDRKERWGGGVLVFVLDEYFPRVTLLDVSEEAERIWAVVHSDRGPFLACCWYRPPDPGNTKSIESFEKEYMVHKVGALGTFVLGDLNVHSKRWLVHSARESAEGQLMAETSRRLGLRQLVRQPTRDKYLLDIVLTDVPDCKASTHAAVADHKSVVTTVSFKVPETASHTREMLDFRDADWERLNTEIAEADWNFLRDSQPSKGAQMLTEKLLCIAERSIPKKQVSVKKSTHPWLSTECEEAVRRKHNAQGTDTEREMAQECSAVLMQHHYAFIQKTRSELADAKTSSKSWWSKARQLLDQKSKACSIPALKEGPTWCLDAKQRPTVLPTRSREQMS